MLADVLDQVSLIYRISPFSWVVYDHDEPFGDCRKAPVNRVIPTMRRTHTVLWAFWLSALVVLSAVPLASQITSPTSEIKPPDLDVILQRIEDAQHQNPAQSRPYEVTREYKVFQI